MSESEEVKARIRGKIEHAMADVYRDGKACGARDERERIIKVIETEVFNSFIVQKLKDAILQEHPQRILRAGTTQCPRDGATLEWECVPGMRLKREIEPGKFAYNARCPSCGSHYDVAAPRG